MKTTLWFENITNDLYKLGKTILALAVLLTAVGWIFIFSCTILKTTPDYTFFKKQVLATIIGLLLCVFIANINYNKLKKFVYPLVGITVLLLILVFFCGSKVKGAYRWLPIPFIGNFQPSELAKITCVLLTAKFLDEHKSKIANGKKELWILLGIILIICLLILLQPDIGIPFIIFSVTFLLLLTTVKIKHLLKLFILALLIFTTAIIFSPHRTKRISVFLSSQKADTSAAYQIQQSLLALSRGGILGCGLGKGIFKEYYLPEIHTDFIFCTIGEELGFFGSIVVVGLYTLFGIVGLLLANKIYYTPNGFFGSMLFLGLTLNIVIQAYISIAVVAKLFPPKGIGLPFISYGGSSLLINFLAIGIMLSIIRHTKLYKKSV